MCTECVVMRGWNKSSSKSLVVLHPVKKKKEGLEKNTNLICMPSAFVHFISMYSVIVCYRIGE